LDGLCFDVVFFAEPLFDELLFDVVFFTELLFDELLFDKLLLDVLLFDVLLLDVLLLAVRPLSVLLLAVLFCDDFSAKTKPFDASRFLEDLALGLNSRHKRIQKSKSLSDLNPSPLT